MVHSNLTALLEQYDEEHRQRINAFMQKINKK